MALTLPEEVLRRRIESVHDAVIVAAAAVGGDGGGGGGGGGGD